MTRAERFKEIMREKMNEDDERYEAYLNAGGEIIRFNTAIEAGIIRSTAALVDEVNAQLDSEFPPED